MCVASLHFRILCIVLQHVRVEHGARTVYVTAVAVTAPLYATRIPAVLIVRTVSKAVTVTTTSTSVSSVTRVTTSRTALTPSELSSVSVTLDSLSTTQLCVKV